MIRMPRFRMTDGRAIGGRGMYVLLAVTLAAISVLVSAAFARDSRVRAANPLQLIVPSHAVQKVAFTSASGMRITAWAVPTTDGRTCTFFEQGTAAALVDTFYSDGRSAGGSYCPSDPTYTPAAGAFTAFISYVANPAGGYNVVIEGGTEPGSSITRFAIESPSRPLGIDSGDGYFVGELPGTVSQLDAIPPGGPYALIGYAADGSILVNQDLAGVAKPPAERAAS
jgi:hypothetical protein